MYCEYSSNVPSKLKSHRQSQTISGKSWNFDTKMGKKPGIDILYTFTHTDICLCECVLKHSDHAQRILNAYLLDDRFY